MSSIIVPIVLFGWLPFAILMLGLYPARYATAFVFAAGVCFLPVAGYALPGLPDYTKVSAINLGALAGLVIFHSHLILAVKPSILDIPAAVLCVCPMASSITNGLGPYDGLAASIDMTTQWFVPYFIGRCVYRDADDLAVLAKVMLAFALLYVPLCLWEARMSPQLHAQIYGFHQHSFGQTVRFGGYRPTVFMNHGLMVAIWMGSCFTLAYAAWRVGGVRTIFGVPMWSLLATLGFTFLIIKSLGALFLAVVAIGLLELCRLTKSTAALLSFPLIVSAYISMQLTGDFPTAVIVDLVSSNVSVDRAQSLQFRFDNESVLIEKAKEKSTFGWGGWGRNRVYDENGKDITVTDGLWIIMFGINGYVGLISLYSMLLLGPALVVFSIGSRDWLNNRTLGYAIGFVLICGIHAVDSLPNGMPLHVVVVATGAITTTILVQKYNPQQQGIIVAVDPSYWQGQLFEESQDGRSSII